MLADIMHCVVILANNQAVLMEFSPLGLLTINAVSQDLLAQHTWVDHSWCNHE